MTPIPVSSERPGDIMWPVQMKSLEIHHFAPKSTICTRSDRVAAQLRFGHPASPARQFRPPQHEISTPRPPYGREGVGGRSGEAGLARTSHKELIFVAQMNSDPVSKPRTTITGRRTREAAGRTKIERKLRDLAQKCEMVRNCVSRRRSQFPKKSAASG